MCVTRLRHSIDLVEMTGRRSMLVRLYEHWRAAPAERQVPWSSALHWLGVSARWPGRSGGRPRSWRTASSCACRNRSAASCRSASTRPTRRCATTSRRRRALDALRAGQTIAIFTGGGPTAPLKLPLHRFARAPTTCPGRTSPTVCGAGAAALLRRTEWPDVSRCEQDQHGWRIALLVGDSTSAAASLSTCGSGRPFHARSWRRSPRLLSPCASCAAKSTPLRTTPGVPALLDPLLLALGRLPGRSP
jgi:hypothetical protein